MWKIDLRQTQVQKNVKSEGPRERKMEVKFRKIEQIFCANRSATTAGQKIKKGNKQVTKGQHTNEYFKT